MKKEKISNFFAIISLIFLIIPTIILWVIIGKNSTVVFITTLVGIISLINLSTILINLFSEEEISEDIPLMKHHMNKALTYSIFFFGVSFPLFLDAWNKGFRENTSQLVISIIIFVVGILIYNISYLRRDQLIELSLIKQNKQNKK